MLPSDATSDATSSNKLANGHVNKFAEKSHVRRNSSIKDLGALERVPLTRLICFLTSLPITLALLAFLLSDPPLEVTLPPLDPHSGNSTGNFLLRSGCPLTHQKNFFFPHGQWHASLQPRDYPRLGIMTTTAAGLDQILPWLYYHRTLGVEQFFIFAEGSASTPENVAVLETIPGVKVIPRTKELDELQSYKPGRNKTLLWDMAGKPCNYELFVKQALNGDMAIPIARAAGVEWLIHIDTDELLNPAGTPTLSLQELFSTINSTTNYVVFTNYESVVERDDVHDPFVEVTLFKKSSEHVHKDVFGKHAGEASHGNPNYMLTYGNGKSAARMVEGLRSNGAHRFNNPSTKYKEQILKEASVLHYSYTKFSDLTSRGKRCHCKLTKKSVKKCFFLDFDRQAYIVAATMTEEQMLMWYRKRVVWTNKTQVLKMLRKNMFGRIYTPQVIIRGLYSSGLIEATLKAGQEEFQRRQFLRKLQERNATYYASHGIISSSSRAAEGAWNNILSSVYGLVGSKQGQGVGDLGLRGQSLKDLLKMAGIQGKSGKSRKLAG